MLYTGNQQTQPSIWSHQPIITPERKLWRAVLEQAYVDAELPMSSDAWEPMERTLARRFLRADGVSEAEDLKRVCEFAEVPADRVFLWARQRYPVEQKFEKHMECGGLAAAFATGPLMRSTKREQGSRTPQIAA
jgi:hypothetical protein